jgi:BNR repeat-like domain
VIWRNASFGLPVGPRGATKLLFARTRDAGRTWTSPVEIDTAGLSDFFGTPEVSALRDGTLVATTSLANRSGGTDLLAYRSRNHGRTWSAPAVIRTVTDGDLPAICGQSVSGGDTGAAAGQQTVLNGRTVTFVTLDGAAAAAGRGAIVQSWSRDGGRHWHSRTVIRRDRPILMPSVSAGHHGRLGLVWDEVNSSAASCAAQTIPSRSRFTESRDGGAHWKHAVTVGAPSWNLASGARGTGGFSGYFIGDYQSLAPIPGGFTTATVQGRPLVRPHRQPKVTGDTGVMVASIRR